MIGKGIVIAFSVVFPICLLVISAISLPTTYNFYLSENSYTYLVLFLGSIFGIIFATFLIGMTIKNRKRLFFMPKK